MHSSARTNAGFTLVELIVVIILIGIVSVYAASRFVGVASFSAFTAQEQAISIIRQIQLSRMQSNLSAEQLQSNGYYTLAVTPDCVGSVAACQAGNDDARSDVLRGDQLSFASSVSLNNQSLSFDLLGNPVGITQPGLTILISAPDSSTQICINSQGYVSRGGCV
ncbi:prepilin-type N-terminal cleavage/methylation domain-containing protein [Vibrio sp. ABG19]|uniref:prepilin-type N-terminal cleavage/methylation domain-containing protein n=1 Tax=Vibrio sp. ABG19 TaxID=2817385 RepID=UPI00249F0E81|nr:prepilin-type N-terminal cleavage/methylation domain-containing protein [Vibrio sp. ABG19]WGY48576.1 prepilin-type N-terminal cleavage/methylation domain-containing protein [Vibrio sp. ABG19]